MFFTNGKGFAVYAKPCGNSFFSFFAARAWARAPMWFFIHDYSTSVSNTVLPVSLHTMDTVPPL